MSRLVFILLTVVSQYSFSGFAAADCMGALSPQLQSGLAVEVATPTLEEVFKSSEEMVLPEVRPHRDRVYDLDSIANGDRLWIAKEYIEEIAPGLEGFSEIRSEVIEVRVVDKSHRADAVSIEVQAIEGSGETLLPLNYLIHLFRHPDYTSRAPFEPGEWVQVGSDDAPIVISSTGETHWTNMTMGTFVRMTADGRYLVRIGKTGSRGSIESISGRAVSGLKTGTQQRFEEAIAPFLELEFTYELGEVVYVRLTNGMLVEATVDEHQEDGNYAITTASGLTATVHHSLLSKEVGPYVPQTIFKRFPTEFPITEKIYGTTLADFLDGARKMVSHPDFIDATDPQKLDFVARFVNRFFKEDHGAAERYGKEITENMLCTGIGMCNHKAFVTTNILSEAGFNAGTAIASVGREGHGCTVVTMPDGVEYNVDPGKPREVTTREQAAETAAETRDTDPGLSALYYTNPDRQIYFTRD